VLRVEAGGSFTGTAINVSKEAVIYQALGATPVPVPRVLGVAPGGSALLLERVDGRGDLGDTAEEHEATLADFVDVIATMHSLDVESLDLPGFPRPRTPEEHAYLDLLGWSRLARDGVARLAPLGRYVGAFLLAHPPSEVARTCVVQGDTGPGNFVADRGRVTGLCDMEFSHIGDPMDDIAWMVYRGALPQPLRGPLLQRYSQRSGIEVNQRSVEYYTIAVQYRCLVTTSMAVSRGGGARGWPPYLLVTERYVLGAAAALCQYLGIEVPTVELPEAAETPRTSWYDALISALRGAGKGLSAPGGEGDELLATATRDHQILVHYLRAYDRIGPAVDALNRDDLLTTLAVRDEGPDFEKLVEEAGGVADHQVLGYLLRRTQRNAALWQTLLDRGARRE